MFNESRDPVLVGKYLTNIIMYADDLVLLSNSKEGLQKCLEVLHVFCKNWKLNVDTEKTKIMIFNKSGRLLKSNKFTFLT